MTYSPTPLGKMLQKQDDAKREAEFPKDSNAEQSTFRKLLTAQTDRLALLTDTICREEPTWRCLSCRDTAYILIDGPYIRDMGYAPLNAKLCFCETGTNVCRKDRWSRDARLTKPYCDCRNCNRKGSDGEEEIPI